MGRYVIRRLLFSIPVLFLSSILVFWVTRASTDPSTRFTLLRAPVRAS